MTKLETGCVLVVLVMVFGVLLGGFCTQYSIDFWGTYLKGEPVAVPFFPCAVAGIVVGIPAIPIAAVTWLLSFVL